MKTKLTKTKKILAFLMAIVISVSCLSAYDIGFAKTRDIQLDTVMSDSIDGNGDLIMYHFKCKESGMYTLLSLGVIKTEAYLFVKETKPDGSKQYTQLAFSNSSPNFEKYGQSHASVFCLTYHLEAGKDYYYGVGVNSNDVTSYSLKTKLICEKYDANLIDHIVAECPTSLTWYTDGEWQTDANNEQYFYYNISRIVANTKVTVYYTTGTVKSITGGHMIDGLEISYIHNQTKNHWYSQKDENYLSNDLTVKILDKTYTFDVKIEEGALYPVKGRVVDYTTNEPIAGVNILINSLAVASTDDNGNFAFVSAKGNYDAIIRGAHTIDRSIKLIVSSENGKNDYTQTPYKIINCDYVDDDVINTKDAAFVNNSDMSADIKVNELSEIDKFLGADSTIY